MTLRAGRVHGHTNADALWDEVFADLETVDLQLDVWVCARCHRSGYRGFMVAFDGRSWVCTSVSSCRNREHRQNTTTETEGTPS